MFSITDNERLRDAYALLMFMQSDIPASAEKRSAVKNLAATVKMEIRAYNNRPVSNVRIISADYDGRLELVQLPDKLDEAHEMDATNWFLNHRYLFLSTPSARRATAKTETKSLFSNKLYNILHEFRRALIYNWSKSYPNHAK